MIVPFSKDNVNKEPRPQSVFLTVVPADMQSIVNVMAQVEGQGWIARFVTFAGMTKGTNIMVANQPSIPVFALIICKTFNEGEEIIEPVLSTPNQSEVVG